MSDNTSLDEFAESGQQEKGTETTEEEDAFGWGSFGKPPEDWSASRVEDLFEIRKNSADPDELNENKLVRLYSMPAYDDGAVPELIKSKNIGSKKFIVPNMSLLFSKLNISKKRFWLVDHSHEEPALCSTEYWPVLPNQRVNLEFYLQYFNSDSFINRPRLSTSSTTNSHQRIKSNLFNKVKLPVPPIVEQRKIATVLHTVDQAIQKTEDVIRSLQRILRGTRRDVMKNGIHAHQMSDSDSRFGDVPEVWDIERLDSVTDVTGGSTPSTDESKYWSGEIPWATPTDLTGLDEIKIRDTESHITEEGLNSTSTNLLPPKSVLVTSRATIGECAVNTVEMATNQGFQSLVPGESVDTWYLYYRMQEEANYLNSLGSGSTFSEVSNTTVQRVKIPIPPIGEQGQIADILKSIDEARIQEEEYKTQLQQLKQGLMQDLLSGTVRTADADVEIPDEIEQYG
jgi:type I restriction enzyme S subunit